MLQHQATRHDGITLIEMMIVVAVVALLSALAVPNLREFVIRTRIETAANEFVTALNLARSESIRRREPVRFVNKHPDAKTNPNWSKGWKIETQAGEVIRDWRELDAPLTLIGSRYTTGDAGGGRYGLLFWPDGRVYEGTAKAYAFVLCYKNRIVALKEDWPEVAGSPRSRAVSINREGRIRLSMPDPDNDNKLMHDVYFNPDPKDESLIAGTTEAAASSCKSVKTTP